MNFDKDVIFIEIYIFNQCGGGVFETVMRFQIQDPTYGNTKPLRETILNNCSGMGAGAGAYAFATSEGVNFLLGDERFRDFISDGSFFLVVGTDDITNVRALRTLKDFEDEFSGNLKVSVYIHDAIGSIFHPKYSWFQSKVSGGKLIIGSGNMTKRGMKNNREAYAIIELDEGQMVEVKQEWNRWVMHSRQYLYSLDDAIDIMSQRDRSLIGRFVHALKKAMGIG